VTGPGAPQASPVPPATAAATIVLARDGETGLEVLLLERHGRSRFAPGAFAFPGGRIEAADAPPDAPRFCRGLTRAEAARTLGDVEPPEHAIAFWVGVLRELFEETGLLLAYAPDGELFHPDPDTGTRLARHRSRCRFDTRAFLAMLGEEGLTLATDRMVYYAHWITPEERPVRYDARFFVAAAPATAAPEPDGLETVGHRWLDPGDAVARSRGGELSLVFVTRAVLESMAPYPDVRALLQAARTREIRAIRPRVVRVDGAERILLPGDPGYF
jgi:8-oxo-dGTP pyrophosphatase MutT (NUDIX family)